MAEVRIAGSNPTGLLLACELAHRRIPFELVEGAPGESVSCVLQPRSLEILAQLGLADAFIAAGQVIRRARFFIDGAEQLALDFETLITEGTPYPFQLNLLPGETQRILAQAFEARGGGINSTAQAARFSIMCHRSPEPFKESHREAVLVADVDFDGAPEDEQRIGVSEDGIIALFPLGGRRARVLASPAEDALAARASRCLPGLQIARVIESRTVNIGLGTHADLPADGVFLCGEALYRPSPFGGQDVNAGIQDAWNLAWKLALVLDGRAGPALLGSYAPERRPVGEFFGATLDRLFAEARATGVAASLTRRVVAPSLARMARGRPDLRRLVLLALTNLGVHYQASPLVGRGAHDARNGPLPGDRASFRPNPSRRFQLILGAEGRARPPPTDEVARELETRHPGLIEVFAEYDRPEPDQFLLRPDGHVAWRSRGWDVSEVTGRLAATLDN